MKGDEIKVGDILENFRYFREILFFTWAVTINLRGFGPSISNSLRPFCGWLGFT